MIPFDLRIRLPRETRTAVQPVSDLRLDATQVFEKPYSSLAIITSEITQIPILKRKDRHSCIEHVKDRPARGKQVVCLEEKHGAVEARNRCPELLDTQAPGLVGKYAHQCVSIISVAFFDSPDHR